MIVELAKIDLSSIDKIKLAARLVELEKSVRLGEQNATAQEYYQLTREAVNAKKSRDLRAKFFSLVLAESTAK